MNAITLIAMIFSFLLGGGDEKIGDDKGQPIVVARNERVPSPTAAISEKLKSSGYVEFNIDNDWTDKIDTSLVSHNYLMYEKHKIILDPPTDCFVQLFVSDPYGKDGDRWERTVKIKSGQFLEDVAEEMNFIGFKIRGSNGQKVSVSKKFEPVTFDIAKKEFKKEIKLPYCVNAYVTPSGNIEGVSEVIEIPAGYEFEAHLKNKLSLTVNYLKDLKPGKTVDLPMPGCFGPLSATGSVTEDTQVVFRCHSYPSILVVTIKPIKGFKKPSDKLASTTPSTKSE